MKKLGKGQGLEQLREDLLVQEGTDMKHILARGSREEKSSKYFGRSWMEFISF